MFVCTGESLSTKLLLSGLIVYHIDITTVRLLQSDLLASGFEGDTTHTQLQLYRGCYSSAGCTPLVPIPITL